MNGTAEDFVRVKIDARREALGGSRTDSASVVFQYALHEETSARGCAGRFRSPRVPSIGLLAARMVGQRIPGAMP